MRDDNAAREANRDPAFKAMVKEEVRRVRQAMHDFIAAEGI